MDYKESWAPKNWCLKTVVLEKTLESPLDSKEIQPVHPKGDHSWVFIVRTDAGAEAPILWPPDVKYWLIWKDPDTGKDRRREENFMIWKEKLSKFQRLGIIFSVNFDLHIIYKLITNFQCWRLLCHFSVILNNFNIIMDILNNT